MAPPVALCHKQDNQTKRVFNGSALGKQYSTEAIQECCLQVTVPRQNTQLRLPSEPLGLQPRANATAAETQAYQKPDKDLLLPAALGNLLETVM